MKKANIQEAQLLCVTCSNEYLKCNHHLWMLRMRRLIFFNDIFLTSTCLHLDIMVNSELLNSASPSWLPVILLSRGLYQEEGSGAGCI
jgi:hypothetical protein